jgi:hypothetical protein
VLPSRRAAAADVQRERGLLDGQYEAFVGAIAELLPRFMSTHGHVREEQLARRIHAVLVAEHVEGADVACPVPDQASIGRILKQLPKSMHGTCERMPQRLEGGKRVYYWQQTGDPAPRGPGAATSRERTVRLQRHVNQNMDMVQRLLWDYPSDSRVPANSESESDGEEEEGGSVQLEYEFFVALLRDCHDVLTAGTTPMPIPTPHRLVLSALSCVSALQQLS